MTKILLATLVFAVAGGGFLIWRQREAAAKAAQVEAEILKELSGEDIRLILESQRRSDPETIRTLAATPESRRMFLEGIREHLVLAAEARREGLSQHANFKRNLEYKKNILIADLYKAKLSAEAGKPFVVPKEEIETIFNDPNHVVDLQADLKALHEIQVAVSRIKDEGFVPPALQGEPLTRARENWARTKILSDRAKADDAFIRLPELQLRFRILEAGILSSDYLRVHWLDKIKATDAEITEYLNAHPEYDLDAKRALAENVRARAVAGEDFAKLAKEFSEHRPSKNSGGLIEFEIGSGEWPELVEAVRNVQPGEVVPTLVRSEYGLHVVRLKGRKNADQPNEKVAIQHVLFQNKFEQPGLSDPNTPAPFMTAQEIARSEVEKRKRNAFVDAVKARNPITMPDDFRLSQ